jgi:bacterioferritin
MVRAFKFDVGPVVEQLDRILQMELAGVICYTHYSFMVYGHARIPITS